MYLGFFVAYAKVILEADVKIRNIIPAFGLFFLS